MRLSRSPASPLLLAAIFLATGLTAQEAAAQVETAVTSTDAVSDGEVTEVRRRRRRAVEDEEDAAAEDEEEFEEADREPREQVVVVEQEDKFGPLYCAVCSCLAPPLWPLWVILMIVVDNDQPPTHMNRRQDERHDPNGVPPPLKPMDERENAMAVLY